MLFVSECSFRSVSLSFKKQVSCQARFAALCKTWFGQVGLSGFVNVPNQ
jgi:hypothetical protein